MDEPRSARARDLDEALELPTVIDNREASRFELVLDGHTATLAYERTPRSLVLVHTEVPPALRGRHLADTLANVEEQAPSRDTHDSGWQR